MPLPRVVAVAESSPASRAGLLPGDEIRSMNGQVPRDIIEYQLIADEPVVDLEVTRGGLDVALYVEKDTGEPLGAEIASALFDQVRTCDNHCQFCFIYQLPKGMRKSLYLKDDDYRLSFLYGNFTTLTRFTEADLERVVTERLSPLYVSIHATDGEVRARMLRNRRGALSLRWLRQLLDHGIEVHGQVVVCPGVNDGGVLHDTMAGVLDRFPELSTVALVPLGVSDYTTEAAMRPHTADEAGTVLDAVAEWQPIFQAALGRRLVYAADEYYLLASRPFPPSSDYDGFPQHENGIGMVRAFEGELLGERGESKVRSGFFQWVEGAPAEGYRAVRLPPQGRGQPVPTAARGRPVSILTGEYGARVLGPLIARAGLGEVEILAVQNRFFGGNIAVAGLLAGVDVAAVLAEAPRERRYLLPDVCLSNGLFLDGFWIEDLPRAVEVIPTDGAALRTAILSGGAPGPPEALSALPGRARPAPVSAPPGGSGPGRPQTEPAAVAVTLARR
jgi:putative radical SAM enzyme (TIGR03279 family)